VQKVVIAGGGPAGSLLALALDQVGVRVRILDPKPMSHDQGVVLLWSNALNVLARVKSVTQGGTLADALLDVVHDGAGSVLEQMRVLGWEGQELWPIPIGEISMEAGAPSVIVTRQGLYGLLDQELQQRDGIERSAVGLWELDDRGTHVRCFDDEGLAMDAALAIGADGAGSRVRAILLDDDLTFRKANQWLVVGEHHGMRRADLDRLLPSGALPFSLMGRDAAMWATRVGDVVHFMGSLRVRYESPDGPFGSDADAAFAVEVAHAKDGNLREDRVLALLEKGLRGVWPPVLGLLDGTGCRVRRLMRVRDRWPTRRWHAGRVGLIGDAAHPLTVDVGQGLGLALEDGVALAEEVARHGASPGALSSFQRRRKRRVDAMATRSFVTTIGGLPGTDVGTWARDMFLTHVAPTVALAGQKEMLTRDVPTGELLRPGA
jgi:2-polyprenyl-6-methoxyphenol hydroxylase-like FAD-dependent oxidoreductase